MAKKSLLDLLTLQMECTYLSDLRLLSDGQRAQLARLLESLSAQDEDLRDWNDALCYLTDAPTAETAQAAKEELVRALSRPRQAQGQEER